jgi:hypothetical protein
MCSVAMTPILRKEMTSPIPLAPSKAFPYVIQFNSTHPNIAFLLASLHASSFKERVLTRRTFAVTGPSSSKANARCAVDETEQLS